LESLLKEAGGFYFADENWFKINNLL
jgi:hypothetical protein